MFRFFIVFLLLSTYCIAQPPLSDEEFKGVINAFTAASRTNYEGYPLPKGVHIKSPLSLHLESMTPKQKHAHYRHTNLLIQASLDTLNPEVLTPIGNIELIENELNSEAEGKFNLHFINIADVYQGKGYGSVALDLSIMLTYRLASHSDFYKRLSLQCSDYDGEKHLGNIPSRLKFYLNHGFELDQLTRVFMRHLDVSYFVQSLDGEMFINFLRDSDSKDNPLLSYIPFAECILTHLKATYAKAKPLSPDALLQIAESSSSDATQCILNRLYYDPRLDDETQGKTGKQINKMYLDVMDWSAQLAKREHLLSNRRKSKSRNIGHRYNPNELKDIFRHIFYVYKQFIDNSLENDKSVTRSGEEDRSVKMRKVSSDDTLL